MVAPRIDVVGLGENSVDEVYRLDGPLQPDVKLSILAHRIHCGGQVATTLAACAAFGLRSAYVGTFGSDENGGRIRRALERHGIDTAAAELRDCPNRRAVILVDHRSGARSVLWQRDERLAMTREDVPRGLIANARLLHVDDLDPEASIGAAQVARAAGLPVTSDIDRVGTHTTALLERVTVPVFASHVPEALTGYSDAGKALRTLYQAHHAFTCVTLGARGALLFDGRDLHEVPAFPVRVVDTTGAGDVFRGALIRGLLRGEVPADSLRFAAAAAALCCTREGALDSVPSLPEVVQLLGGPAGDAP